MEDSILTSTKKVLGLTEDYTIFDLDIITYINSAFAVLKQLGVGDTTSTFSIEDSTQTWSNFTSNPDELGMVKTYMYLKVGMLFDPPTTSFLIEAKNNQLSEYEYRLKLIKELDWTDDTTIPPP